jgi:dTDP-4-amino-4,6-dideoxygalactose transaminase
MSLIESIRQPISEDLKTFKPLTDNQGLFFESYKIGEYFMMLSGSAGTGKSFIALYKALEEVNVESRPLWKPMHMQPLFENSKAITDGTSEKLYNKGLCLASSTTMTKDDIIMICDVIKRNLG